MTMPMSEKLSAMPSISMVAPIQLPRKGAPASPTGWAGSGSFSGSGSGSGMGSHLTSSSSASTSGSCAGSVMH